MENHWSELGFTGERSNMQQRQKPWNRSNGGSFVCFVFYYSCVDGSIVTLRFWIRFYSWLFCFLSINDYLNPVPYSSYCKIIPLHSLPKFDHCSPSRSEMRSSLVNCLSLRVSSCQMIRNHTASCKFTLIHLCRIIPLKPGSWILGSFN